MLNPNETSLATATPSANTEAAYYKQAEAHMLAALQQEHPGFKAAFINLEDYRDAETSKYNSKGILEAFDRAEVDAKGNMFTELAWRAFAKAVLKIPQAQTALAENNSTYSSTQAVADGHSIIRAKILNTVAPSGKPVAFTPDIQKPKALSFYDTQQTSFKHETYQEELNKFVFWHENSHILQHALYLKGEEYLMHINAQQMFLLTEDEFNSLANYRESAADTFACSMLLLEAIHGEDELKFEAATQTIQTVVYERECATHDVEHLSCDSLNVLLEEAPELWKNKADTLERFTGEDGAINIREVYNYASDIATEHALLPGCDEFEAHKAAMEANERNLEALKYMFGQAHKRAQQHTTTKAVLARTAHFPTL